MRIAIVGSRGYQPLSHVRKVVARLPSGAVVVSGHALGVDRCAAETARERGLEVVEYPADWKRHGRRAGFIRNRTIVQDSDRVIAFWDGSSAGTAHTIQIARLVIVRPLIVFDAAGRWKVVTTWPRANAGADISQAVAKEGKA